MTVKHTMKNTVLSAWADISEGLSRWRVWWSLAREDIGDQHRNTALGPAWFLINYLLHLGTFLAVFGEAFQVPNYPAYVASGLLVWLYVSEVINRSTTMFQREEALINGTTLPLMVYVMRLTTQSIIRSGYAFAGCIVVLLLAETPVSLAWFGSLAGILLILATTPAVAIVFGMLGAFFPDTQFIVTNLTRVGIFLTPVFWTHGSGLRGALYQYNPFTYYLQIVRQPIVTDQIPWLALGICLVAGLLFWALAITLLGRLRKQIVFVL